MSKYKFVFYPNKHSCAHSDIEIIERHEWHNLGYRRHCRLKKVKGSEYCHAHRLHHLAQDIKRGFETLENCIKEFIKLK